MDDNADLELEDIDIVNLRKSMFICHNERDEYVQHVKMKKRMRWSSTSEGVPTTSRALIDPLFTENQALKNVDILENIAIHLSMEDLLRCRLVCRLWSTEMASFLFKRKCLIVVDKECENAESLLKKRIDGHPTALSKLSLFNVNAECLLFRNLFSVFGSALSNVSLEDCLLSPKALNRLLLKDAPSIVSFHFREGDKKTVKKSTLKLMKEENSNQELTLPNLKILHWDEEHGKTELVDIVKACPSLVVLELRNFPMPRSCHFKGLQCSSLTKLFLSPKRCLTDEHCKALTHLKLRLKKLTLFGINSGDQRSIKSLNKFLSSLRDTLEVLELWLDYASMIAEEPRGIHYSPLPVSLPKVKRLQTESEVIGHINHLNKFSSLKELEIVSNSFHGQNWDRLTNRATIQNQSNLQSFRCGDIDSKSLSKVLRTFPNITSLHFYATYVNDGFLRTIIKSLTCLVDLTISPCMKSNTLRISDSGLTGVPKDFCRKFNQNPKQSGSVDLTSVKTQPGISDLKCLQKLDLGLQTSEISDASIVLGVCALSELCSLKLPLCQITDASIVAIQEKLPKLILLGVAGCHSVSEEATDVLKRHRTNLFIERDMPASIERMIRE